MAIEWGSVASWVSGLGSFAAVATALYLSRDAQRVKLNGYCGLRSCLGIPISDQIAQRCGNCSVIVTEKHLDGRGPLGLAMTAVKICAAVIFYCPVFASETWVYTTMIRIISG